MHPFEVASGLSVYWMHLTVVSIAGVFVIISAIGCLISFMLQLHDTHGKFSYGLLIKVFILVFIVSLIIACMGSM